MALVVEDGSGKSDAESYASVAEADAYLAARTAVADWTSANTAAKEAALRQGTEYIDSRYSGRWRGEQVGITQALSWPRFDVIDDDGRSISSTTIPIQLNRATIEAAIRQITTDLDPDISAADSGVKKEKVKVGPIAKELEYTGSRPSGIRYIVIERLLAQLLAVGPNKVVRS